MLAPCPLPTTGRAFLQTVLNHIDCQAQSIGGDGYQALAAPGSAMSLALTGIITIFVALIGIRMLLGRVPDLRYGVVAAINVGIVLLLAMSWPAYRTLAYDTILKGPAELVAAIGGANGLPGAGGGLTERLQRVDDAFVAFGNAGTGRNDIAPPATPRAPGEPDFRRSPLADDIGFAWGRIAYLAGTLGPLVIVRLAAGLLLALAPLFAGLLLFDATRGLFEGWMRGLIATALGAAGLAIVHGVELAILEPWIADALAQRAARLATPAAPTEMIVVTMGFAVAALGIVALVTRVAFMVHVPAGAFYQLGQGNRSGRQSFGVGSADDVVPRTLPAAQDMSRASQIAQAVTAMQRRETAALSQTGAAPGAQGRGSSSSAVAAPAMSVAGRPVGAARRAQHRGSLSATRRDRRP